MFAKLTYGWDLGRMSGHLSRNVPYDCAVNRNRIERHPMGEMRIPNSPGAILGMDLIGPFFKSDKGNSYALITIDHLTGWTKVIAVPLKSADSVQMHWLSRFGLDTEFPKWLFVIVVVNSVHHPHKSISSNLELNSAFSLPLTLRQMLGRSISIAR